MSKIMLEIKPRWRQPWFLQNLGPILTLVSFFSFLPFTCFCCVPCLSVYSRDKMGLAHLEFKNIKWLQFTSHHRIKNFISHY